MKVQKALLADNLPAWLVIDDDFMPIKPIFKYLLYLFNLQKSPNTLRAYAHHLKLYWEFLSATNQHWDKVTFNDVASFIGWLRLYQKDNVISLSKDSGKRKESTINAIVAAVTQFYEFQHDLGNCSIKLTQTIMTRAKAYKPLLHHITKSHPIKSKRFKIKVPKQIPKTIDEPTFELLLNACNKLRDKFLVYLLYETGMRVGQALGLKHEDVISWNNEIHIIPRLNNPNLARSKSLNANIIHVSKELILLYSEYITKELNNLESEYVFVQNNGADIGKPIAYEAVRSLFLRLSKNINRKVTAHMLRHTHATQLIRSGWDPSLVQKRLGHSSIQTTLDIYTNLDVSDLKKAFYDYQQRRIKHDSTK